MEAYTFVLSGPVVLGDRVCPMDLVAIPIREFDLVLGMDWLTRHIAVIDCEKREVRLQEPGHPELIFQACKSTYFETFISSTRARSLIQSGCSAYLASVDLITRPTSSVMDIPVVS